jgi:D-3-phosphoglycerate dehydrogenase
LLGLPNLVVSPHLGYANARVFEAFSQGTAEALLAWLAGSPIRLTATD